MKLKAALGKALKVTAHAAWLGEEQQGWAMMGGPGPSPVEQERLRVVETETESVEVDES